MLNISAKLNEKISLSLIRSFFLSFFLSFVLSFSLFFSLFCLILSLSFFLSLSLSLSLYLSISISAVKSFSVRHCKKWRILLLIKALEMISSQLTFTNVDHFSAETTRNKFERMKNASIPFELEVGWRFLSQKKTKRWTVRKMEGERKNE